MSGWTLRHANMRHPTSNGRLRNQRSAWAIELLTSPVILLPLIPLVNRRLVPDDAGYAAIGYGGAVAIGYIFLCLTSIAVAAVILAVNFQRSRAARALLLGIVLSAAAGLVPVVRLD